MTNRMPARNLKTICLISITFLSLMVVLMNGCGGSYPSTPDQVVLEFRKAYVSQDMKKAGTFCTAKFRSTPFFTLYDQAVSGKTKLPESVLAKKYAKDIIKRIEDSPEKYKTSIEGNTAKVWKDFEPVKYLLVKEGGRWKLDAFDTTDIEPWVNSMQKRTNDGK